MKKSLLLFTLVSITQLSLAAENCKLHTSNSELFDQEGNRTQIGDSFAKRIKKNKDYTLVYTEKFKPGKMEGYFDSGDGFYSRTRLSALGADALLNVIDNAKNEFLLLEHYETRTRDNNKIERESGIVVYKVQEYYSDDEQKMKRIARTQESWTVKISGGGKESKLNEKFWKEVADYYLKHCEVF